MSAPKEKIAALIARAAHPSTPVEEARTAAVIACRVLHESGLLESAPQPASRQTAHTPTAEEAAALEFFRKYGHLREVVAEVVRRTEELERAWERAGGRSGGSGRKNYSTGSPADYENAPIPPATKINISYRSKCAACQRTILSGSAAWRRRNRGVCCLSCGPSTLDADGFAR